MNDTVVMLDCDAEELSEAAATLPGALAITCDVSIPQQVAQAIEDGRGDLRAPRRSG